MSETTYTGNQQSSTTTRRGVCDPLLDALKECLLKSDCVVNKGRLPSECLKNHFDELEEPCRHLRLALFDCKRSKLDMRRRFRGHAGIKPSSETTSSSSSSIPTVNPVADVTTESVDVVENGGT